MSLTPLSASSASNLKGVSLVATDMDGTLTRDGLFTSSLLQALEALADAKIAVIIVTGRSAGWVQGIKSYLPIAGAIAENGGIFYPQDSDYPEILIPIPNLLQHRQQLSQVFQQLKIQFPQITESADNCFRLTDWTFDIQQLSLLELQQMADICAENGWGFTYSNVQCHIKPINQDKATSLLKLISTRFINLTTNQIVTIGDSPNDESLFDLSKFPFSVGVANILKYASTLKHLPVYITTAPEEQGFIELANLLLQF
ncbi:Haloacid dehalogenase domain protein hydrolase type 3 [Crinalium epipsammum PCC 9333]|uniref:Haloacid dehalogenase domain protein hydrolase type 3 n=1 Tax=Crinalium epipsammum PCC 9333 TaxID=1173022 RepID=K9VYI5_9CYAN|nr:HAD family hydrolase [Crinalium epipsammum]AFZ12594.1 Haloacid dehalogenase domain protein hydrolase type 3 [Crinalium epipsammum PCC 9333]